MALLRVVTGDHSGKVYPLEGEKLVIGRDSEQIPVSDQGVSRHHAEIFRIGELFFIRDLGSRNGTYVNTTRVEDQEILRVGDRVHVGNTELVFEDRFARALDSRVIRFGDSVDNPGSTIVFRFASSAAQAPAKEKEPTATERHLATLSRVSELLATGQTLELAFQEVAKELGKALGADHVYLFAFGDEGSEDEFRTVAAYDRVPTNELAVSRSILRRVRSEARAVLSSDAMLDDRFATSESIVMKRIKSLLCAPLLVTNRTVGAFYATNSKLAEVFKAEDLALATTIGMLVGNAVAVHRMLENQGQTYRDVLKTLASAAAMRDPATKGKADRVATLAVAIARGLGMPTADARNMWIAGLLHDIGSLALAEVELKNAVNIEQRKTKLAKELLAELPGLAEIVPAVALHNERFDGSGFPDGRKGNDIPLGAEIVGLACHFEGLLAPAASAQRELSVKEALIQVRDLAGRKFSTKVVNGLLIAYRRNLLFQEDRQIFATEL